MWSLRCREKRGDGARSVGTLNSRREYGESGEWQWYIGLFFRNERRFVRVCATNGAGSSVSGSQQRDWTPGSIVHLDQSWCNEGIKNPCNNYTEHSVSARDTSDKYTAAGIKVYTSLSRETKRVYSFAQKFRHCRTWLNWAVCRL